MIKEIKIDWLKDNYKFPLYSEDDESINKNIEESISSIADSDKEDSMYRNNNLKYLEERDEY